MKSNLDGKTWALIVGLIVVVGLAAGLIGGNLALGNSSKVTGNTIYQNTQTLLVRPDNTRADTWIPFTDGSVYLTSDGKKDGGFVFRKWMNGSTDTTAKFSNLMVLTSNGNLGIGTMNPKAKLDVNGDLYATRIYVSDKPALIQTFNLTSIDIINWRITFQDITKNSPQNQVITTDGSFLGSKGALTLANGQMVTVVLTGNTTGNNLNISILGKQYNLFQKITITSNDFTASSYACVDFDGTLFRSSKPCQ